MKRKVVLYKHGDVPDLDLKVLTAWMGDNHFPDTIDPSGWVGNASDDTIHWTMQQSHWAVVMTERAEHEVLKRFPMLRSHERREYSNRYCRQLWCDTYRPGDNAEEYE